MTYDVAVSGERIERLLGALVGSETRATAEELLREIVGLYGAGLERVMAIVTEAGAAGALRGLAEDPLVSGLLVLHDLHPLTTAERVRAALDGHPHGHGAELLSVEGGVVRLRLEGACGCPSSRIAVTESIERAIARVAPEVARVEVESAVTLLQIGRRPA
ncbi:NifU family protein [Microbispora sp. NBRC 16548]|uniref:NifU family protein n=1 Tax=Microbispora sp. NBRC 16548 TaxID=3030994 RepID=UPI00161D42F2|nr:NifU family protein [Microbispora sp. NBRC 16548]GLX09543.1 thioredoxin [Microbispora sp. NBRC 16548]